MVVLGVGTKPVPPSVQAVEIKLAHAKLRTPRFSTTLFPRERNNYVPDACRYSNLSQQVEPTCERRSVRYHESLQSMTAAPCY